MRTLPQFSCTKSRIALDSSSLAACSTGGGVRGSSSRLAILRRFGAGPGCGGEPHCTVLLCRSSSCFRPNELSHTVHTNGLGLQPLACRCKVKRRVKARPHVAHLCIVIVVVVVVVVGVVVAVVVACREDCSDWTNLER